MPSSIVEHHVSLTNLWAKLGADAKTHQAVSAGEPQAHTDDQIVEIAGNAKNGDKFRMLFAGEWRSNYLSQSEADQAIINIIAFYTKNEEQIARVFRLSALGRRDKATRADYVGGMIAKSFDGKLRPIQGLEELVAQMGGAIENHITARDKGGSATYTWELPPTIGRDEFYSARVSPDIIVENFLYADVGVLIGAGSSGKTTFILWLAAHIALGFNLFGMPVQKPGPVLILTAEDGREIVVARLREICRAMNLSESDKYNVAMNVRISDVSGVGLKLTQIEHDVVKPAYRVIDQIVAGCHILQPVLIVIDPTVSFGVGESRVNDAEQGLVEAARRLRRALNCCVLYVHHTGKQNAREKQLDQYAGRGGSAMADGARMVHVLRPMLPDEWLQRTGEGLEPGESGLILARPKMSYVVMQPPLLIRRRGYLFERIEVKADAHEVQLQATDDGVWQLLADELAAGRHHSKHSLEGLETRLTRPKLRAAISRLEASGRIENRQRPGILQRGAREYIHPVSAPSDGEGHLL